MKVSIIDGKIAECTENELYDYWLSRGYDDIYSFPEFMQRCIDAGTVVTGDEE